MPAWLAARRWYVAKDGSRPEAGITDVLPLDGESDAAFVVLTAIPPGQPSQSYLLPRALRRGEALEAERAATVAEVRIGGERAPCPERG